jgi:hypothetical protein
MCSCGVSFKTASPAKAAVYYVSTTGSDSNDGSINSPWLTIQKAANMAQAGDTILVKTGNYDERVALPSGKSGTPSAPITFRAEPRRTVNMKGFKGATNDYIRIEGFNITHNAGGWLGGGIWLDGNYWEIIDNYFYDVAGSAIQPTWQSGKTTNYVVLRNNHMYRCNKGFIVTGTGWLVENNEVERLIYYSEDADYSRFFGDNHVIKGNYFHGTIASEVGSSHVDAFQSFNNNGSWARNIVFENNIVLGMVHQVFMLEGADGSHDNIMIRNNIFANSYSWGICAHGTTNMQIHNNVFAYIASSGIGFRSARTGSRNGSTGEIKNNIFFEVLAPYWKEVGSSFDAANNLIYKNGKSYDHASFPNDLVNIEPQFIDAVGGNFYLSAGSPAIDAGTPLSGFSWDMRGVARPQSGGWDIGPYETTYAANRPSPPGRVRLVSN